MTLIDSFNKFLTRLPFPTSGLVIAIAAIGILYPKYLQGLELDIVPEFIPTSSNLYSTLGTFLCDTLSSILYIVFGTTAAVLWLLILIKMILRRDEFLEALRSPMVASVLATFPMSLIVLSVYIHNIIGDSAVIFWCIGIGLHVSFIIFFSIRFLRKPLLEKVFPSWFVMYIGIIIAPITSPYFSQSFVPIVAHSILIFGAVLGVILFPPTIYRCIKLPLEDHAKPLVCIFAAPVSIVLAGYMRCCDASVDIIFAMLVIETVIFTFVLLKLPRLLKLPFYPSYAAFTFSFVVTSTAYVYGIFALVDAKMIAADLFWVPLLIVLLVSGLVVYVFIRYAMFLFSPHQNRKA